MKKNAGFTLIELLVVVLIIGILASVALPQYERAVEKARAAEAFVLLKNIADANRVYYMANGFYATHIDELDIEIPGEDTVYNGWRRKQTDKFMFGTKSQGSATSIALANRLPFGQIYFLYINHNTEGVFCQFYNVKGEEICKSLSGGHKEGGYYVIR